MLAILVNGGSHEAPDCRGIAFCVDGMQVACRRGKELTGEVNGYHVVDQFVDVGWSAFSDMVGQKFVGEQSVGVFS